MELTPEKRILIVGLIVSAIIHMVFMYLFTSPLPEKIYKPTLREVSYEEMLIKKKKNINPKVKKLIEKEKKEASPPPKKSPKILAKEIKPIELKKPKLEEETKINLALTKKALVPEQQTTSLEKIDIQKFNNWKKFRHL